MTTTTSQKTSDKKKGRDKDGTGESRARTEEDDVMTCRILSQENSATEGANNVAYGPTKTTNRARISQGLSPLFEDTLSDDVQDSSVEAVHSSTQMEGNTSEFLQINSTSPTDNAAAVYNTEDGTIETPSDIRNDKSYTAEGTALPGHFPLFDLPQELQDQIFALAHPREDDLRLISKRDWDDRQQHKRKTGGSSVPKPFIPKVNAWLVSRRYFRQAPNAWMGAQLFSQSHSEILLSDNSGLFMEYATDLSIRVFSNLSKHAFGMVARGRSLKTLSVVLSDNIFDEIQDKLAWTSRLSDTELAFVAEANGMRIAAELHELRFVSSPHSLYIKTADERATFAYNIKRLERLVWEQNREPMRVAKGTENVGGLPLYCQSEVFYDPPPSPTSLPSFVELDVNANDELFLDQIKALLHSVEAESKQRNLFSGKPIVETEDIYTPLHAISDDSTATTISPPRARHPEHTKHSLANLPKEYAFNAAGMLAYIAHLVPLLIHSLALFIGYSIIYLATILLVYMAFGVPLNGLWSCACNSAFAP